MQLKDVMDLLFDAAIVGLMAEFGRWVQAETRASEVHERLMTLDYVTWAKHSVKSPKGEIKQSPSSTIAVGTEKE